MKIQPWFCRILLAFCLISTGALAANPVLIGLDAEFGHKSSTSARAVQQGIEIAIEEINRAGGVLDGRRLELVISDNRSIPSIAIDNLRELAKKPDLVAVFGGKFSPIYIESLPIVHETSLPLMDPWGSADGITDHSYRPSFTFRLSLKDEWAAPAFVRQAAKRYGARRIGALLPNTAWGRSNLAALQNATAKSNVSLVAHRWYNWGDTTLIKLYQELRSAGAQALILVANETEGSILVKELAALPPAERLPVISHWGVTGGHFTRMTDGALNQLDFSVIQTYSFIGQTNPIAKRVLGEMKRKYNVPDAEAVLSPVGVAHAYDLTHLLARAIRKAGTTDRRKIRDALERLDPYEGLLQRYEKPFTPDRHDALSSRNILFARYTADDRLIPIR